MNLSAPQHRLEAAEDPAFGTARASRFLTVEDTGRLVQFYLGFDFEARHSRFGNDASDDAIIQYCDWIEWRHALLIARTSAHGLEAVLEIHPLSQQWDCAELIASCALAGERSHIFAQLLQIAGVSAGRRGCRTFLVPLNDTSRELLPLLQGMGRVRIATTQACVDLSAYAAPRERSAPMSWTMPAADLQANAQFA
jgi:hypothetical protein